MNHSADETPRSKQRAAPTRHDIRCWNSSKSSDFRYSNFRGWIFFVVFALSLHQAAPVTRANPTQEDVFKSISNNVSNADNKIDGRKLLGFVAGAAGLVILIVLVNNRQQRQELPKVTNHQGKLLRELMKAAGLKSSQIRQLKTISGDLAAKGEPVRNLTTLLLCPSLIKRARELDTRK